MDFFFTLLLVFLSYSEPLSKYRGPFNAKLSQRMKDVRENLSFSILLADKWTAAFRQKFFKDRVAAINDAIEALTGIEKHIAQTRDLMKTKGGKKIQSGAYETNRWNAAYINELIVRRKKLELQILVQKIEKGESVTDYIAPCTNLQFYETATDLELHQEMMMLAMVKIDDADGLANELLYHLRAILEAAMQDYANGVGPPEGPWKGNDGLMFRKKDLEGAFKAIPDLITRIELMKKAEFEKTAFVTLISNMYTKLTSYWSY